MTTTRDFSVLMPFTVRVPALAMLPLPRVSMLPVPVVAMSPVSVVM